MPDVAAEKSQDNVASGSSRRALTLFANSSSRADDASCNRVDEKASTMAHVLERVLTWNQNYNCVSIKDINGLASTHKVTFVRRGESEHISSSLRSLGNFRETGILSEDNKILEVF